MELFRMPGRRRRESTSLDILVTRQMFDEESGMESDLTRSEQQGHRRDPAQQNKICALRGTN